MADAQLNILLKLKDEASAGLKTLESNLQSTDKKFGNYQQTLGMARTAGLALTGATAAIGGVALKSAIDYESAFAGVKKTVNATEEELALLNDGILEMSKRLPQSATEIAGVAEAAGQLGIETGNILGFTETMVKLGMSTNMSSEEAATALARLANITGMPQTEFGKLGSTIVDLGNNLATTEGEIVEMGLRLAGAGATVGMTEAEILGFSGALSSVGIAAESGGTAFSKVMLGMYSATQNGGEALTSFAAVAGMSADEFKAKFETDAAGAITAFIGGLGTMQAEGQNVLPVLDSLELGEIRVRDALLRASGAQDTFADAQAIAASAWEENNALNEEAARRVETTASQMSILKNNLSEVAINIGNALMPALKGLMEFLGPIIEKVGKFASDHPAVVAAIVAIAGAVGGIMLALSTAASVAKGLKAVQTAIKGIGVAMKAASATNPILLALTAIALAAYLIIDNWDKIKPWLEKFWEWLKGVFTGAWDAIKKVFTDAFNWVKDTIEKAIDGWKLIFTTTWDTIKGVFTDAWDAIKGVWDGAITFFQGIPGKIESALTTVWDKVTTPFRKAKDDVLDWLGGIGDWFKNLPANIGSWFSGLAEKIKSPFKTGINAIIDAANWLIRGLNKISFELPSWVPGVGGKSFGINISQITRLYAKGGPIPEPTLLTSLRTMKPYAIAGEAGPEAIIPLNQWNRGGGNVYNINISAGAFVGDRAGADQFADFIIDSLRTKQRYSYGAAQF